MSEYKVDHLLKTILKKIFRRAFNKTVKAIKKEEKKSPKPSDRDDLEKAHEWRLCPIGEHWITDHPLWVPATEERPGYYTTRDGHCAANPTRGNARIIKDYLSTEEMQMIADKYFSNLSGPPSSGILSEYNGSDNFDKFIRGWTRYWNDIFKPDDPLDPNLVKALIATESTFQLKPVAPNAGVAGKAHGLIQLTDQAIKALGDPNGELLNHLVKISTEDTYDPNLSIGASIRWLFRKRDLAKHRLKRQATWREAVAEYKSYLPDMVSGKNPNPTQMIKLDGIYERLKK